MSKLVAFDGSGLGGVGATVYVNSDAVTRILPDQSSFGGSGIGSAIHTVDGSVTYVTEPPDTVASKLGA